MLPLPVSGSTGGAALQLLGIKTRRPAQEFFWELNAGPIEARLKTRQKPKALCVGLSRDTEATGLLWHPVENCTPVGTLEFVPELQPVSAWTCGIPHSNRLLR